jgi:integrase
MNATAPRFALPDSQTINSPDHQLPSDYQLAGPARRRGKQVKSDDGRVNVTYWPTTWRNKQRRRIYRKWYFINPAAAGGRREARNTESALRARAKEVANDIANGQVSLLSFTQADKASYLRARELVRPTGKSLELVASEYAEAIAIASTPESPHVSVIEMARFYNSHAVTLIAPHTCPEILTEMLVMRKQDGASKNTLDDYASRLGLFTRDFTCPVLSITGKALDDWLSKLDVSRRTRNNYRGNLVDFYRFAKRRGYVPKTWSVLDAVPRVKDEPVNVAVFHPAEFAKIITTAEDLEAGMAARRRRYKTVVPYLAIGAFSGMRHEELCAGRDPRGNPLPVLDWRQVNLKRKEIRVLKEVARKIGRDRTIPMPDNLVAWLTPYARTSGPICELANVTNAVLRAARKAGVKWKHNGTRKSFVTYRLDLVKDIGQVALEAGTSPARINKNYKAPTAPFHPSDADPNLVEEESVAWFKILPTRPDSDPLFAWGKRGGN